jgi:hypothetical protein
VHPRSSGDDVPANPRVTMRGGNGWGILDMSRYSGKPGVHDIGAALDLTSATIVLVVLRAAESWAPETDVTRPDAIVCREGRVLLQFADGSMQQLDRDAEFLPNLSPLLSVSNLSTSIAETLLIARKE